MASTNAAIFRQEFINTIQRVIGEHPAHHLLAQNSRPVKGGGESTWIPGVDAYASDDASIASYADDETLKKFHQLDGGSQTFAEWLKTRTPFNDTVKINSLSSAELIEWGHTWNLTEDDDWITVVDPRSSDMGVCAQKIHKTLDIQFAQAVIATTVQRKVGGTAVAAISLPASQVMADLTYATATVDTIPAMIRETLGNWYVTAGMPVFCAVSTTLARNLKKNDSDLLRSRDFIASYEEFKNGTLPSVEGVTFIEMPKQFMEAVKAPEGVASGDQTDHYFAWCPEAVASVSYKPMMLNIDEDPGAKFDEVAYVRQLQDFVRTDDKGVVVGDIVIP
jgi:hypothetical protein